MQLASPLRYNTNSNSFRNFPFERGEGVCNYFFSLTINGGTNV